MRTVTQLISIALLAVSASAILSGSRPAFAGEVCLGKPVTMSGAGAIEGTVGNVVILGSSGGDVILGLGVADTVCALGGNDDVTMGAGVDLVDGGTVDDRLYGEAGNDSLSGGTGVLDRCPGGEGLGDTADAS